MNVAQAGETCHDNSSKVLHCQQLCCVPLSFDATLCCNFDSNTSFCFCFSFCFNNAIVGHCLLISLPK